MIIILVWRATYPRYNFHRDVMFHFSISVMARHHLPHFILRRRETLRQERLKQAKAALEALEREGLKAYVFGSILKPGAYGEWSDTDFAIEGELDFSRYTQALGIIEHYVDGEIDLVFTEQARSPVLDRIKAEGKNAAGLC